MLTDEAACILAIRSTLLEMLADAFAVGDADEAERLIAEIHWWGTACVAVPAEMLS